MPFYETLALWIFVLEEDSETNLLYTKQRSIFKIERLELKRWLGD